MKKDDQFIYTNPITNISQKATYTGTKREIKGVDYYFFNMQDGKCCFFYPSEVKEPVFVKI
jgi:beta-galactosidase beta subunit